MTIQRGAAIVTVAAALLLLAPAPLVGETVDPFFAAIPVEDRSDASRRAALREALGRALVKLSGTEAAAALARGVPVDPLVRQYRYQTASDEGGEILLLEVAFVSDGVRRIAIEGGVPIWPVERRPTAVWIAIDDGAGRRLFGLEAEDEAALAALSEAAEERALPILFPLLDLEDQTRLTAAEIWGGFDDRVSEATARYGELNALAGRLTPDGEGWRGRWSLDAGGALERWETVGPTQAAVLGAAADELAERLARQFAVRSGPAAEEGVQLFVTGVEAPATYAAVMAYLESRSVVEGLRLAAIDGSTLELSLRLAGDAAALERILALDDALLPERTFVGAPLTYRVGSLAAPKR